MELNNYYPFPNRVLRKEKKGAGYTADWGKAIWSYDQTLSNEAINKSRKDKFSENKHYRNGTQSVEKFKDRYAIEKDNRTGKRKGYSDIDFRVTPVAPRIADNLIEILSEKDNRTNIVFSDVDSLREKEKAKYQLKAKADLQDFNKEVNQMRGLPQQEDQDEFLPKSKKDLDMYELNGGIRMPLEVGLEKGIDYILNYDIDWDENYGTDIKDSLITNSVAAIFTSVDAATGRIVVDMVDPENLIIDGSKFYDYRDAQFAGRVTSKTVLDVYKGYNATEKKQMSEEDIKKLAEISVGRVEEYTGVIMNKDWYDSQLSSELTNYEPARVQVLDFFYLSIDIVEKILPKVEKKIIKGNVRDGELESGKIQYDGKHYIKKFKKKTKETVEVEVWRRGKWVVGTDIVYDYGVVYDQLRDEQGVPIPPFQVIKLRSNSIIERNIPHFDSIQNDIFKIESLMSNMKGYSVAIDLDAISNLKMGGKDFNEAQVLKAYKLGGTLFYSSKKSGVYSQQGGRQIPLSELEGGIGRAFVELNQNIVFRMQQIYTNTGLNEVAMAQNPNPEVTAAQAEMANSGAKNAIMNIYHAYKKLKKGVAYRLSLHLQNEAKRGNDYYKEMIGEESFKALKSKKAHIANREIKIIDSPSTAEKQALMQQMNMSLQQQTLKPSDIFELTALLEEGKPLKVIAMVMSYKEEKAAKEQQENAQAAQQANDAKQQEMVKMKLQFEQAIKNMEGKMKSMLSKQEAQQDLQKLNEEYQLKDINAEKDDVREAQLFGEPKINNTDSRVS